MVRLQRRLIVCGIVGIYRSPGPPPHRDIWPDLVNHLIHRGPDEGGWWADGPFFLGQRRLSIIDLSSGQQPMATDDGRLVVVFNGEIYNHMELRQELGMKGHRFLTASDTEVLLHGFREWGKDLPSKLIGMFAFAIADRVKGELFLARDRFGEKPLFFCRVGDAFHFASEIRPLAAIPGFARRINEGALAAYLTLNYCPGTEMLMDGVKRLEPGRWKLVSPSGESEGAYWTLPEAQPEADRRPADMNSAQEEFRELFDRSVKLTLRSDVPVGIFLSGGMDSSLVAESAMRQGRLNLAFCVDFEQSSYREYPFAKAVAERLGLPLERVVLTPDALDDFGRMVEHSDDPMADSSSVAVWTLSAFTKALGNKVVLGGDGGDELFGGYLTYRATRIHRSATRFLPAGLCRLLSAAGRRLPTSETKVSFSYKLRRFLRAAHLPAGQAHFSWNGTWLPEEAAGLLRPGPAKVAALSALGVLAERWGTARSTGLFSLQRADIREYLANDILVKTDRMSMAHGLETRAPFLDHRLAKWALERPEQEKISSGGELKAILRTAARRVFGNEMADRPKQGFSLPIHQWIRGRMAEKVRELLSPASMEAMGLMDPSAVAKVMDDHMSGRRSYGFELWGLAVLSMWHRLRIEKAPEKPAHLPLRERAFPLE